MTFSLGRRKAAIAMVSMLGVSAGAVLGRPTRSAITFTDTHLDSMFPSSFGNWSVDPSIVPLLPNPQLQKVISETYDQTLARTYRSTAGEYVMLSVAYGGHQREDMSTHRPEVCYPAQGMSLRKSSWQDQLDVSGQPLRVRRLVAGNGSRNEPITYWLVVGRQVADFGVEHKWVTMKYGLTGRIPDGMLVRVSTIDDNEARSFAVQNRFAQQMLLAMRPLDRQRIMGTLG